jgi:uncharacterized membrane protein YphA (DoxX/SURF4 family)
MIGGPVATGAGMLVGGVLLASGALKLADHTWRSQAAQLGIPSVLAICVPWLELGLGAAVATGLGTPWTDLAAAVLLAAFTAFVVTKLARGERPPCACFGRLSTKPIGPWTVVRNLGLLVLVLVSALD